MGRQDMNHGATHINPQTDRKIQAYMRINRLLQAYVDHVRKLVSLNNPYSYLLYSPSFPFFPLLFPSSSHVFFSFPLPPSCCCCRPHHPPKMVERSNNRIQAHRPMVSPHLAGIRACWLTGVPLHSASRCLTSTGAVHKSVTFSCVFMLVQLNKCVVVCGSDLQRGHSADGVCLRGFCLNMRVVGDICLF